MGGGSFGDIYLGVGANGEKVRVFGESEQRRMGASGVGRFEDGSALKESTWHKSGHS